MNPIRDEQQRNGERRLTPGLAADGQRYGNLSDQVHVVEVAEGQLPKVFAQTHVDGEMGTDGASEKGELSKSLLVLGEEYFDTFKTTTTENKQLTHAAIEK